MDELDIPYAMAPPRPNPHPFSQVPVLTDGSNKPIWESGAILIYLATKYDPVYDVAEHAPWVVWANSALDPICFQEDSNGRVLGTTLDKPNRKIAVLEDILSTSDYVCSNVFSVADIAVASYLNYVPLFNGPNVDLSNTPNIVKYMKRCAEREKFGGAFGEQHRNVVVGCCGRVLEGGGGRKKGIFGF